MSFLHHIRRCNRFDPTHFRPFEVAGQQVGRVRTEFATRLAAFPEVFTVKDDRVALDHRLADAATRTRVLREVTGQLAAAGALPAPRGEHYPVVTEWGQPPLLVIDRELVSAFGLRAFGVHVNGVVRSADGMKLWIGRRAPDKSVEPNKLDNMVAGGQPVGLSLADNLVKEAAEEAAIPAQLARRAVPVGAIRYCMEGRLGLKPDTLFVYDLEVPADFVPHNTDGEIAEFTLMAVEEVAELVRTTEAFKFNVALVLIDFLIRTGRLSPDTEPDYLALVGGLRGGF